MTETYQSNQVPGGATTGDHLSSSVQQQLKSDVNPHTVRERDAGGLHVGVHDIVQPATSASFTADSKDLGDGEERSRPPSHHYVPMQENYQTNHVSGGNGGHHSAAVQHHSTVDGSSHALASETDGGALHVTVNGHDAVSPVTSAANFVNADNKDLVSHGEDRSRPSSHHYVSSSESYQANQHINSSARSGDHHSSSGHHHPVQDNGSHTSVGEADSGALHHGHNTASPATSVAGNFISSDVKPLALVHPEEFSRPPSHHYVAMPEGYQTNHIAANNGGHHLSSQHHPNSAHHSSSQHQLTDSSGHALAMSHFDLAPQVWASPGGHGHDQPRYNGFSSPFGAGGTVATVSGSGHYSLRSDWGASAVYDGSSGAYVPIGQDGRRMSPDRMSLVPNLGKLENYLPVILVYTTILVCRG